MASVIRSLPITRVFASAVPRGTARPIALAASRHAFSTSRIALEKRYAKDHEWVDLDLEKKTAVIGISEYAAEKLGDVVYVELPEVGAELKAGDTMGAVESVKSASDILAPISCRVVHVNTALEDKPSTINQAPEDLSGGWIAKVELDDVSIKSFNELMTFADYDKFTQSGDH
ncbi:Glycine cleavage system H protein [Ceratocystis fimbriata CBS 114723]|uniref:Glycine cleavage system H protein n=2 Tax=Ceratocystis TaxID=5157 RepID=A0A0F8DCV4_CERFI|nr:Glycine cleavage system H protein [Ceratocystis platani]PHH52200.1 Glycine cleavage system H protein [Ceratocystis fimbriata CBS 114723]